MQVTTRTLAASFGMQFAVMLALFASGCSGSGSTSMTPTQSTMQERGLLSNAASNPQIVLSATGIQTSVGPGGFWLWSQPGAPSNAYGNGGQGSMYFYQVYKTTIPVVVSNTALKGSTITEHVASSDGRIACDFTAVQTTTTGSPNGTVSFTCSAPAGASATDVSATVKISQ
jgi:hypothetical protein